MRRNKKRNIALLFTFLMLSFLLLGAMPVFVKADTGVAFVVPLEAEIDPSQAPMPTESFPIKEELPTQILPEEVTAEVEDSKLQSADIDIDKDEQIVLGQISGYAWADSNENGLMDEAEVKIAGIKVMLFSAADNGQPISETMTDVNGWYAFTDIPQGEYRVAVGPQTIAEENYLLPMKSLQAGTENQFDVSWASEPVLSYTQVLQINEDNSSIMHMHAGMRIETMVMPLSGAYTVKNTATSTVVGFFATLQGAVDACIDTAPYTITATTDDVDLGAGVTIPANRNITLTSSSKSNSITQQGNARHITVSTGSTLLLEGIILTGKGNSAGDAENGGIVVQAGGALIIGVGAIIQSCYWADGGGVYAQGAVTVDGGSIINNEAEVDGGGIRATGATIIINSGQISGNQAPNGAGISANAGSTITMNGGFIKANINADRGGGVNLDGGTTFKMNAGEISLNQAKKGGAIISNGSTITIEDGTISGNSASSNNQDDICNGGGICLERSTVTMNRGSITSNTAKDNGGGVYLEAWGGEISKLTASAGTIIDNNAKNGGGVFSIDSTVTLAGGSISGNKATGDGGGIRATGATVIITSGAIDDNQAPNGAGISANAGSNITMNGGFITKNVDADRGGGVNLDGGTTFTMNEGEISFNQAQNGGGIISNGSTIVVTAGIITENEAADNGGGIRLERASLQIDGGSITENTATGSGGGVYLEDWGGTPSAITINIGIIENNHASDGGGIFASNTSVVNLSGGSIIGNDATSDGGGIRVTNAKVVITSGQITSNEAPNGAGISANENSNITMNGGFIKENISANRGGGINMDTGILMLDGGEISDNQAQSGGGVIGDNAAEITVDGCTVANNTASVEGGGFRLENNAELTIKDGKITGNAAEIDGGGIRATSATITFIDGEITSNEAAYGGGISANTNSVVVMNGGGVNTNIAKWRGGGVNIDDNTTFTISSGVIDGNRAKDGGGVIATKASLVRVNGGEITHNIASISGGGAYISADAALSITAGEIAINTALGDGGGIYTEAYSYTNPLAAGSYGNITIPQITMVSGNGSGSTQTPPTSLEGTIGFDKSLLTNDEINYYPAQIALTYDVNEGLGTSPVIRQQGYGSDVALETPEALGFSTAITWYEFKQWNTQADGEGTSYAGDGTGMLEDITEPTTLYAIWGPQMGTISGYVFQDDNKNGAYDSGEGLAGKVATVYKKESDGTYSLTNITATTIAGGSYVLEVEVNQTYKLFFKVVDDDGVGETGFITKGTTNLSNHINQDGFSDEIVVGYQTETEKDHTVNAGYAPPFPPITGTHLGAIIGTGLLFLLSGFFAVGYVCYRCNKKSENKKRL